MAETQPGERRVALAPGAARWYGDLRSGLRIEAGAGEASSFADADYQADGVEVRPDRASLLADADVVLKVQPPSPEEIESIPRGACLVSHWGPGDPSELARALASRGVTAFAVERIPRITRAQKMDVLSSQATVAGYMAVVLGAGAMLRFLPMLTTAAGTIRPAKALVLGAGVAGLQAIATARRLGAVVSAFDVRPAVKEQVESLGAKFLDAELDQSAEDEGGYAKALSQEQHERELALIAAHLPDADLVVATAQIPGKPAPRLITAAMAASMRPGSVVVDLASETGGNCEATRHGETITHEGVTVMGPANLPSRLAFHASSMYARNLAEFVAHVFPDGAAPDFGDEITRATRATPAAGPDRDEPGDGPAADAPPAAPGEETR